MQHFKTITQYNAKINISQPKYPHFDIRRFEDISKSMVKKMPPFRHEFYAIGIKTNGNGKVVCGHHSDYHDNPVLFFNSPYQIYSWDISSGWQGYYVMFSQDYIAKSNVLSNTLNYFPFFNLIEPASVHIPSKHMESILAGFKDISKEYHASASDKFQIIDAQLYLLLSHIRRLYEKETESRVMKAKTNASDLKLVVNYQNMIRTNFHSHSESDPYGNKLSTSYYARNLGVHPNHLNAVVKKNTGLTALKLIHNHLIFLAKSYLHQTDMSVKEIAYHLHFKSPNSFSAFFKRITGHTPIQYRRSKNL